MMAIRSLAFISVITLTAPAAKAQEQNGEYLGGFGDWLFSWFESEAERAERERQQLIDSFAGEDGVMSPDEANALLEYDQKQAQIESEQAIDDLNSLMGNMIAVGENVNSYEKKMVNEQVEELEFIIETVRQSIASGDSVGARIDLQKVSWVPIGREDETDVLYSEQYSSIKRILEDEINKMK